MTTQLDDSIRNGIVVKKTLGQYTVRSADGSSIECALSGNLRKQLIYPTADPSSLRRHVMAVKDLDTVDPVAVGDHVTYLLAEDGTGTIAEIQPRQNKLSRPAVDGGRRFKKSRPIEQVIVANVDQIVVVMPAANPPPHWELLDRYLVTAEAAGVPALICLTKIDLGADGFSREIDLYQQIGYPVILTSAINGTGIDDMQAALRDRVSVLWGKSGVGKTSLLNAIESGLGLRVKAVNEHNGEGRHTTAHLEMFELSCGGSVVDTPGQRAFKIWDEVADYAQLLPEMRPFLGRCKFGLDCTHTREPGCAIKSAVAGGAINQRRYESFLGMREYFRS